MADRNQESKSAVHITNLSGSTGVNLHNPDGQAGTNVNAGSPADNPIQNSLKPAIVVTVAGVRFANPA